MKKKIPVGSRVIYNKEEHTLLGYHIDKDACVIEGPGGIHNGDFPEYWHDENGNRIPYVDGDNRWFVGIGDIKRAKKEKPEFIFGI